MMAEVFQELVLQGTVPPGSLCPLRRSRISKEAERQLYWELLINSKDTRMRKIYIVSACRTPIGKMGGGIAWSAGSQAWGDCHQGGRSQSKDSPGTY